MNGGPCGSVKIVNDDYANGDRLGHIRCLVDSAEPADNRQFRHDHIRRGRASGYGGHSDLPADDSRMRSIFCCPGCCLSHHAPRRIVEITLSVTERYKRIAPDLAEASIVLRDWLIDEQPPNEPAVNRQTKLTVTGSSKCLLSGVAEAYSGFKLLEGRGQGFLKDRLHEARHMKESAYRRPSACRRVVPTI